MFYVKLERRIKMEIDNLVKYISDISLVTRQSGEEIGQGIMICAKDLKEKLKLIKEGRMISK